MLALLAIGVVLAALLILATLRPWLGLLLLLALLPFNGVLLDVVGPSIHLSSNELTLLAAWHDALAGGVILAAAYRWVLQNSHRLNSVEAVAIVLLGFGTISLVISPHLETAAYAFRTEYEPVVLALAIAVLARTAGLAPHLPQRYAIAISISAGIACLFAIWQVYGGGINYLTKYFMTSDGRLPSAYLASFVLQPRAFGTFHSPNEFGAFVVIVLVLMATPGLIQTRRALLPWMAAIMGFALLLSFSRSSWVSLTAAMAMLLVMLPVTRARLADFAGRLRTREWLRSYVPPIVLLVVLVSGVAGSSGFSQFIDGTVTGKDTSAAAHAADLSSLLNGTKVSETAAVAGLTPEPRLEPFGIGLGMVGAKSARFGQVATVDVLASETWYVNYLLQAGYLGLVALLVFVLTVVRALWIKRRIPVARAALAAAAGLSVGALFIPVIDEPAVAIPLWSLIGLGLGSTVTTLGERRPASAPEPANP
jgi:hypothetical protein